jgi:hypothetical protein
MAFTPAQERTLSALLDAIVPPSRDGRMPGAGQAGIAAYVDAAVSEGSQPRADLLRGLAALDTAACARGARDFAGLAPAQRLAALDEVAAALPALVPGLVFHTYAGYYQSAPALEGLGLEARPPHPLGYPLEAGDLGLLDAVRRRPPLYRKC